MVVVGQCEVRGCVGTEVQHHAMVVVAVVVVVVVMNFGPVVVVKAAEPAAVVSLPLEVAGYAVS